MKSILVILISILGISNIFCQSFIDKRDNIKYNYVKIENLYWMTESLNHVTANDSWCYDNKIENCEKFGRLYTFTVAEKVCPSGWRLPTEREVHINSIGELSPKKLNFKYGGKMMKDGSFKDIGELGIMHTRTKTGVGKLSYIRTNLKDIFYETYSNGGAQNVRCVTESDPSTTVSSKNLSYDQETNLEIQLQTKNDKVNDKPISLSATKYDGVYAYVNGKYFEVPSTMARKGHYVHGMGTPQGKRGYTKTYQYPEVYYSTTKNLSYTSKPSKFILKGTDFTNNRISNVSIHLLKTISLSRNKYFYSSKDGQVANGFAFMPEWNHKTEKYKQLEFKKKRISENHYEILISDELKKGDEYVIQINSKMWIFKIK